MPKKAKVDKQLVNELLDALNSGTSKKLFDFIFEKDEDARQSLLSVAKDWVAMRIRRAWFGGKTSDERDELVRMIQLAILGFYDLKSIQKEWKKLPDRLLGFDDLSALDVQRSRSRKFADEFMLWRLGRQDIYWPVYWKCHKNGLCSRLFDDVVILKMLDNMSRPGWQTEDDKLSVEQIWAKYPELFEIEFWYIFEREFTKPHGFVFFDSLGINPGMWTNAILGFVEQNLVQRDRLLDATLGTLAFSYSDHEMRWYSNLHRKLQPSAEEAKQREERYFDLLDNRNPSSIALGFEMLVQLDKAGQLDNRLFLQRIEPIFREKSKSRPKTAVGIIERIAKRDKSLPKQAVLTAMAALHHEAVEVQTAAAKLIFRHLDPNDKETLAELQRIKPSLHDSVQALFPMTDQTVSSTEKFVEIVPRIFGPLDLPRLDSLAKLKPVETIDELIDLAAKVLATPSEIDEIEILVDGIMRLHLLRDADFVHKASALRKSVLDGKLFRWARNNYLFGKYLACIVCVWLSDSVTVNPGTRSVKFRIGERTNSFMASNRLFAETHFGNLQIGHAERIAHGIVLQPLSTPTHHGGWIDPIILVERIKSDSHELRQHDTLDKVLSLYRLPSDHHKDALKALGNHLPGDPYVDALRAVLGAENVNVSEPHYFVAIQVNRQTRKNEPIFRVDLQTNAMSDMRLAMPDRVVDKSLVPLFGLASVLHELPHYENTWVRAMLQWCGNLCPAIRDPFYWHSHSVLQLEIEDKYDYPGPDAFLEPLCDPNEPVTEAAATALLAALVVKPESLATLAQDILIASIGDGRLTEITLAGAADFWMRNHLPKRIRWIKRFKTAAAQSAGHANVIRAMLEKIVSNLDSKEVGGFLELLNECCAATGKSISNPVCREYLASFSGSGKAAKLAKKLLEM